MAKKNCIQYKGKTYTKQEFEQYLKDNDLKDIVSKINGTLPKPKRISGYEVSEEKVNRINDKIAKGLPVSANDPADLFLINKLVFGLTDEQAETAAIVADRMLKSMGQAKSLELKTKMIAAQEAGNQELVNELEEQRININPYQNVFYTKNMGAPNTNVLNQDSASGEIEVKDKRRDILDEITDEKIGEENYQQFSIDFKDGARAFGNIRDGIASISTIDAPKNNGIVIRGTKTYERVLSKLKEKGITTVSIKLQSKDSAIAIDKLVSKGILTNPRDMRGGSMNERATTFDISNQIEMPKSSSIILNQDMQENPFLDVPQSEPHGAVRIFDNQNALIYAISNPNVTTPLHELAHIYEQYLTEEEQKILRDFSPKKDKRSISETFARGFEKYLSDGKAPDASLQGIFDKFNTWLKEIYHKIKGSPIDIELNEPMKAIYAKMLGIEQPSLKSDNKESKEPETAISGDSLAQMTDNEFERLFADEYDIEEDDPKVLFQKEEQTNPSLEQTITNAKQFKAWAKKSILAGKFDVREAKYTATAIFNAFGKNESQIGKILGLGENLSKEQLLDILTKEVQIILDSKAPNTKDNKWKDGELVSEESRKNVKNPTVAMAAAIARKDAEFDKLKKQIVSGKLMNHGSSGDVTSEIFFLNEFRRKYFNSRGITPAELNQFLLNNKEGVDVDFKAVKDNFKKAFGGGDVEDTFLGGQRVIDGQIQPNDVHAVAARYLFDDNIDEETRAFILQGTPPRTQQPRDVAEAFVGKILKNLKKAAYEAADKEKGGTASTVEKNRRYKEELLEMAKMDRLLSMMSHMGNGKNSAVEVMSKLGNNDNNGQVLFEETEASSASGTELLLLTHIISELKGLGSSQEVAQVVNIQSRLATQYGRAISYLRTLTDGKTFSGKALVLQLTRKAVEAKNTRKGKAKSDVNSDETVEETLQNIADKGTTITEESKVEFEETVNKDIDAAYDKIQKKGNSRQKNTAEIKRMAKSISDKLSEKEKQQIADELQKDLDENIKLQDSVNITDKLISMALEEVVKERIAKGYPTELESKEIQKALYERYNELMDEVASMMENGKLTKEGGQQFRKKFGVAKNYSGLKDGIKEPFNEALGRNKQKLEEQVQEVRDAEKYKLIESIGRVGTQNKKVSQATKTGQVKGLIQRGKANKEKMAKERQKQISNTSKEANPQVTAVFEKSVLDLAELLHNVVAQANELGLNLDYTELNEAPYSVFNNQNIRALARELAKTGLKGQALIDEITNNLVFAIEKSEMVLTNDPIQISNPNNQQNIEKVIELMSDAASEIILAYEADFLKREQDRIADEDARLEKMIIDSESKKVKKAILKEQKRLLAELNDKEKFVERAEAFAKKIEEKANKSNIEKLIDKLEEEPKTSQVFTDFVNSITDSGIKNMVESDFSGVGDAEFRQIIDYVANNVPKGKERTEISNELKKKYKKTRDKYATKTGLASLVNKVRKDNADKEGLERLEGERKVDAINMLTSGNLEFITPYHLKLVRAAINSLTDANLKKELTELVDSIEKNSYEAKSDSVMDAFVEILTGIQRRKGGISGQAGTQTAKEKLMEDFSRNEADINAIMEAREEYRTNNPDGEKLAMLDDMLSKLLGKSVGQTQVRTLIKEMLASQNEEAIREGKKTIANILKDFYNNENNREEFRPKLEDFIKESTGITDQDTIDEIVKVFNESYDKVWNENKRKKLESEVDTILRADLNKADNEVKRAQSVYDNDKSKENKQVLDRALRNQKAAKRNYERILRHAPKLPFLAEAIREGMPNNEEFKELFYQAFGLTPFSTEDAKAFESAANMITSENEETKKLGFLALRRLMKRYSSASDFLSVLDIDSLYKMNILSGLGSTISAVWGGVKTQFTSVVGTVLAVVENDIINNIRIFADNAKNKDFQREMNLKVSESVLKSIAEVVMSVPYGMDKAAQIIIRGETDGASLNELESMLTHADRTIADYVMSGYALSPMIWADIITSPEMTPSEVIDRLGMTPEQRITFANSIPNLEAEARRIIRDMPSNVFEAIWSYIKNLPEGIMNRAKIAAINAKIAYKGFSFKNRENLREFVALLSDLIEDKGVIAGSWAATIEVLKALSNKVAAGMIRGAMYLPVIGQRTLSSADIVTNGVSGSGTRQMTNTVEALKINNDYQRKKQGFARIQKELDSKLSNDPNFDSNDAYTYLISQKEMSNEDKKVLNTIVTNNTLSEDDKIYQLSTYVNGDNNPESLTQAIWRELTDADKKIITNLLQGKDKDGRVVTKTVKGVTRPLTETEIIDQLDNYLSGREVDKNNLFKSWYQEVNDMYRGRDDAYDKHSTVVSRLVKRGSLLEERVNPATRAAVSQYQGEMAMNWDVSGRTGYIQRQFSSITGKASARMRKRRITGNKGSAWDRGMDIAKIIGSNFVAALPRMFAGLIKWQQMLLPTSLWQLRLMDISDAKDGSVMGYYKPDPNEYTKTIYGYVPLQWHGTSFLDKFKEWNEINNPYQWRTETRKVVGKKKVGENGEERFVVERKQLPKFVLGSRQAIMAYTTLMIVDRMLRGVKEKQTCISQDGEHILTWGHPDCADCADCKEGTYKDNPPPLIVTGGGYANQGQKFKPNSVYKLVMKPVLDSNGKQIYISKAIYDKDGKFIESKQVPLQEPDYVWDCYWNLDPISSAMYADMAHYRDRVLEAQQKNGVGLEIKGTRMSDWEYYPDALFSLISKVYNSSGVMQTTDDLVKKAKNIIKIADYNSEDEVKQAEAVKAVNDLVTPLGNYTPFMNTMGNDINKWLGLRTQEVKLTDKLRNASATIALMSDIFEGGTRMREHTQIGTRKEPNFRYDAMRMNELRTTEEKAIDKKVFGDAELKTMTFSSPNLTNIARTFKTAGGNISLEDYFDINWLSSGIPTARLEMMHQAAQGYKQKYITDDSLYKVKGTNKSVTVEEAMKDYSDFIKTEILQSVNRYGNNRAQFELLFDLVYDSGKVTDVNKGSSITEPLDGDKEKAKAEFLKTQGKSYFSTDFVLPESIQEAKISADYTVPSGIDYPEYPEYSIGALVKWMALNGVAIKDGKVVYKKPIEETRLLGLEEQKK